MNIAICDDMASERALIARQVNTYLPDALLSEYEDGNRLVKNHAARPFDLIFLDMLMPVTTGMETAEKIRKFDDKTPIVFITATEEFAVQSYRVFAFDYILKPVNSQNIKRCLSRLSAQKRDKKFLTVEYLGVRTNILLDNIAYLESELRKVNFHLIGDKLLTITAKLDDYLEISESRGFCRCHKSFIVNLSQVSRISGEDFLLTGGQRIKISRTFLNDAKRAYFDYVFGGNEKGE